MTLYRVSRDAEIDLMSIFLTGMSAAELDAIADRTRAWAKRGAVFAYFIAGAKVRNPAAAQALIKTLG